MSAQAALTIALVVVSVLAAILVYILVRVVQEMMYLHDDLDQIKDVEHAKCMAAIQMFIGDEYAAQVLSLAADDYAAVTSQGDRERIGRLLWRQDGPPIPSIWLRERADRLRMMAGESS